MTQQPYHLDILLPTYAKLGGVDWVQLDEPILSLIDGKWQQAFGACLQGSASPKADCGKPFGPWAMIPISLDPSPPFTLTRPVVHNPSSMSPKGLTAYPRTPSADNMQVMIDKAVKYVAVERLGVNPDFGLNARNQEKTIKALANMIERLSAKQCKA